MNKRTRRGFIAAVGVTAIGSLAIARSKILTGRTEGAGMVSILSSRGAPRTLDAVPTNAWTAAIDTLVQIDGERGTATARILSVARAPMGGERPAGLRQEALIVTFETDPSYAPDGDKIYAMRTAVSGVSELFLTRGETLFGKAILMAVLN